MRLTVIQTKHNGIQTKHDGIQPKHHGIQTKHNGIQTKYSGTWIGRNAYMMTRCAALLAIAVARMASAASADDIVIERLFGPEIPGGIYKHPAAIEQLDNGDFYVVYYGGEGEYDGDTKVFGSRLKKGETEWSTPATIADTPNRAEGNGVVFQAPDGVVWLFYICRYGDTWSDSRINYKVSHDGAHTWSDSYLLTMEKGTMVRNRPIVLGDGDYLVPIYHETGHDTEIVGADTSSFFLRYNPQKKEWSESTRIYSRMGNLQPAPVEVSPGHLICFCRRGGGYEALDDGWMVRSESNDGGRTWSPGEETKIKNANAAVDLLKLSSGNIMLVFNDNMNDRTPLSVAISTDGGKTFPHQRDILTGEGPYAYPMALEAEDGKIYVIYTTENRTVVMRAIFDEAAILAGGK